MQTDEDELFGCNEQLGMFGGGKKKTEHFMKGTPVQLWSIMIWDCVAANGTGKVSWEQSLEANNRPSVEGGGERLLQVDNDPKNTPKSALEDFQRHNLKALPWPSRSPELNATGNGGIAQN